MNSARHAAKKDRRRRMRQSRESICSEGAAESAERAHRAEEAAEEPLPPGHRQAIPVPKYDGDQAAAQADLDLIPPAVAGIEKGLSSGFERQPFCVVRLI